MNGKMMEMDEYMCNNSFIVLCIEITSQEKLRKWKVEKVDLVKKQALVDCRMYQV